MAEKVIVAIAVFCPGVGGSSASGDFCAESHKDTGSCLVFSTCSSPISSTILQLLSFDGNCSFLSHPFASVSGILAVSDLLHFLSVPTCFYLFVSVSTPAVGATVGAGASPKSTVIYYSFDAI